jgi:steroid delta-isomerase
VLRNLLTAALLLLLPAAAPAQPAAETEIRDTLAQWTVAFNTGRIDEACALFAPDLRFDYRGLPQRNYDDMCAQLRRSLTDPSRTYTYALDLKEIIVAGDLAVVRLTWRLRTTPKGASPIDTVETGMDIFRRQTDGHWRIIRFIAYEE